MNIAGRQLNRREALAGGAGLLGGGALAALMTAPAVAADQSNGFEGAWLVNIQPDDFNVLYLVIRGGGIAAVSDHDPTTGSTGFGAWQDAADNQFVSTFELFAFGPAGILRVRTLGSIDKATGKLKGHAKIDFQLIGSTTFFPPRATTFTGTRIKVVSPDVVGDAADH
jgi:hypothetical protein